MLNDLKAFGKVHGMDMSEEAIHFSRQIFDGEIKKGSLPDDIPYPDNKFDVILALDVLEHIEEDQRSIEAIKNLLVKDGIVLITVPAFMFLWSSHDILNHHKRRYTLKELENKLKSAGFKIERISYFNSILFLPILLYRVFGRLMNKVRSFDAKMPSPALNHILAGIFQLETFILRFLNLPFGVSIIAIARKKR